MPPRPLTVIAEASVNPLLVRICVPEVAMKVSPPVRVRVMPMGKVKLSEREIVPAPAHVIVEESVTVPVVDTEPPVVHVPVNPVRLIFRALVVLQAPVKVTAVDAPVPAIVKSRNVDVVHVTDVNVMSPALPEGSRKSLNVLAAIVSVFPVVLVSVTVRVLVFAFNVRFVLVCVVHTAPVPVSAHVPEPMVKVRAPEPELDKLPMLTF